MSSGPGSQGRLQQFRSTILESFGSHVGGLWRLKRHQKMQSVSDVFLRSKFDEQMMDVDTKVEPSDDDTLP